MEEIRNRNNNQIAGYLIDSTDEIDTLKFSSEIYLRGIIKNNPEGLATEDLTLINGYYIIDEFISNLDKGVRVLTSEKDYYIANLTIGYFMKYFDWCRENKAIYRASMEEGIDVNTFVNHAIVGNKILSQISQEIRKIEK